MDKPPTYEEVWEYSKLIFLTGINLLNFINIKDKHLTEYAYFGALTIRSITKRPKLKTTDYRTIRAQNGPRTKRPKLKMTQGTKCLELILTQGTKNPRHKVTQNKKRPKATMYSVRVVHVFTWQIGALLTGNRLNIFRPVEHFLVYAADMVSRTECCGLFFHRNESSVSDRFFTLKACR
jgi:hypothetical protein